MKREKEEVVTHEYGETEGNDNRVGKIKKKKKKLIIKIKKGTKNRKVSGDEDLDESDNAHYTTTPHNQERRGK